MGKLTNKEHYELETKGFRIFKYVNVSKPKEVTLYYDATNESDEELITYNMNSSLKLKMFRKINNVEIEYDVFTLLPLI